MHRGYTKRWRKRWDKGVHQDHLLWVMMDYFIDFANYEDREFPFFWRGALVEMVKIKRGQCFFTFEGLRNLLNGPLNPVSRKMVRRRVEILEKIEFLAHQQGHHYQIVTILNYDRYNPLPETEGHQSAYQRDTKGTSKGHQRDIPNNINKDNKDKNIYTSEFLSFWDAYPKRIGKGAAYRAWKAIKDRPGIKELTLVIEKQSKSDQWQKQNGQFIPNPATWLNQRRWEDEMGSTRHGEIFKTTEQELEEQWKRTRKR